MRGTQAKASHRVSEPLTETRYLWLVFHHRGIVNRALEVTGLCAQFNVAETVAAALINSL